MNAQIVITITEAGALQVEGTINNKVQALGMLEVAKEAILNMHAENAKRIQAASPAERLALLGGNGGIKS